MLEAERRGIPVPLKDNVNTKDMPTTGGSLSLAGYTPPTDATITSSALARFVWPLIGLALAIIAHSLHNFGANLAERNGFGLVLSLIVAMVGFILVLCTILLSWRYERNSIRTELADEIGLTLTAQEYATLTQHWRNPLHRPKSEWAAAHRLQLCVELALRKRRLRRMGEQWEPALLNEIIQLRAQLAAANPV